MRLFIRAPFFLIISSLFFILYFVTSVAAAPERHELAPPGTPERNPDGSRDETLRRVGEQINTKYPPGLYKLHIDGMRPPNEEGYAGIACDSRQDQALFKPTRMTEGGGKDFYSWDSGSCIDQLNGKPCCQNIDLAGYRIEPGDPRYVITDSQRQQCSEPPDSPDARFRDQRVCDLIEQESSAPQPGNPTQPTGPGDSPAQAELARATAARQEAEQQLNNAQTALASAAAAQQAAEQQAAELAIAERAVQAAEQQSTSVVMELETAASSLVLLEQQVDNAKELVAKLEVRRDDALRILNEARARVAKISGGVGDIQDSAGDRGMDSGSSPLKPGRRFTPDLVAVSGGSGQQCSPTNAIQGSIPLRIICPATLDKPLRAVLDISEGASGQRPVFAIKIKTGPTYHPKWQTRITLHPDRPAIDPSERGRPVTAEIYLGLGMGPDETKFYPTKAEGTFVLIKSIKGEVDIAELEIIEGCRQPDGSINRCAGRGPVGGGQLESKNGVISQLQWDCIPLHQIGSPQDGLGGPGSIIDIPGGDPEDATSPNDIAGGCLRLIVDGTAYGDISINQPKMSDLGNSDFNYIQTQANGDFDGQTGRVLSQTISYIKEYLKITGGPVVTNVVAGAKSTWFLGKVVNGALNKVQGSSDLFSNINSLSESEQSKLFATENERRRREGTLK